MKMMNTTGHLTIGTRQSQLAIWQAEYVKATLSKLHPHINIELHFFVTQGDRVQDKPLPEIGGKGVFTAELEYALLNGEIDLAVHSLKDLPTDLAPEFEISAVPGRASVFDALVSRDGLTLDTLPHGATVGTSSLRRAAQLKSYRPDLQVHSIRGNVPTRIHKALTVDGTYDAIILAQAGLDRLGLSDVVAEVIAPDVMLPAPAQGALGIQHRKADSRIAALLAGLDHPATRLAVTAERGFLNALEAGCRLPVAAWGRYEGDHLRLIGRVIALDGTRMITVDGSISGAHTDTDAVRLGRQLADEALAKGAEALLSALREQTALESEMQKENVIR